MFIAANAVHTVFMIETEIGYGPRKLLQETIMKKKKLYEKNLSL